MLAGLALGIGAAALVAVALPAPGFTTRSIIGVSAPEQSTRQALAQAAREAMRSKPVMTRAAASLLAMNIAPPEPSVMQRVALLAGFGGARDTGREARLAEILLAKVRTALGEGSTTVDVIASDERPEVAAQIAGAVADAFLADQEDRALELRRQRENGAAARTEALIKTASAAHARVLSLGGTMIDPAQARALAAAQSGQAEGRLDTIRAIIASATPPLSDRKDVPDAVAALQRTYLDLTARLATARETLGDRHTTIVSLREGVARASANLTAEWKRLERIARSELDAARGRESALRKPDASADAARRAAIDDARAAAERADEAITKAETTRLESGDEHIYRIYARAPVPSVASGFPGPLRAIIAALAALVSFSCALVAPGRRRETLAVGPERASMTADPAKAAPAKRPARTSFFEQETDEAETIAVPDTTIESESRETRRHEITASGRTEPVREADVGPKEAMRAILARLEAIETQGEVPTIMVAAIDGEIATAPVALALARAAAESGRRVLVIENARPRPALAAFADAESEPVLIDVFGTLRVALELAVDGGGLTLAPAFRNGRRIASALARSGETPFIDEVAGAFDLIVIDGGRAGPDEAVADTYLRVGRYTSRRDDERFLASLGAATEAFAGAMIGRVFVAPTTPRATQPPVRLVDEEPAPQARVSRPRPTMADRPSMPRRALARR